MFDPRAAATILIGTSVVLGGIFGLLATTSTPTASHAVALDPEEMQRIVGGACATLCQTLCDPTDPACSGNCAGQAIGSYCKGGGGGSGSTFVTVSGPAEKEAALSINPNNCNAGRVCKCDTGGACAQKNGGIHYGSHNCTDGDCPKG
jgi:hypothetical protein